MFKFSKGLNSDGKTFAYEFLITDTVVWSLIKSKVEYNFAWIVTEDGVEHSPGNRPHFGHSETREAAQKAADSWVARLKKSGISTQATIFEL